MGLRYDEIGDILKIIDSSACEEFVLETADIRLVVRRRGADGAATSVAPSPAAPALAVAPSAPAPAQRPASQPASPDAAPVPAHVVCAPMVGTFYRSPSPGDPPFVAIGSRVDKGDPICLIEVMKLFTTIHAEWSGTVTEIGVDDAQLVEFGQMLFVIAPE